MKFLLMIMVTLSLAHADLKALKVGQVTQIHGEVSFMSFGPGGKPTQVQARHELITNGSYLTQDGSYLTTQFFDGSWLRASPRSKFAVTVADEGRTLVIHLFTGSVKILFSNNLNEGRLEKVIVKSVESHFEASEAKFSVVRNPLLEQTSTFVEKGMVIVSKETPQGKGGLAYLHRLETIALVDRMEALPAPRKITEKEQRWLHGSSYLKLRDSKNKQQKKGALRPR